MLSRPRVCPSTTSKNNTTYHLVLQALESVLGKESLWIYKGAKPPRFTPPAPGALATKSG